MTQYNNVERQAGTLILSEFRMFNESVVFFEKHIEPAFWKGFDHCVERFIKVNNWKGEAEFAQKEYVWFAPSGWGIEADNYKYWFENHVTTHDGDDFLLAVISNTHTEQGELGFQFTLNSDWFGGPKKRNAYVNNMAQHHRENLVNLGFDDHGKGYFFLPVSINAHQLAECWSEFGAFPDDHDVFAPLRDSLEILRQSADTFDAIFASVTHTEDL